MKRIPYLVVASLAVAPGIASSFELILSEPELNLSVPGVPAATLHEEAASSPSLKRSLTGSASNFTIDVELLPQLTRVSPRVCAGILVRSLVAQPGMPNRDSIYRAPLNESTFLVIYTLGEGQAQKLHAHVISAAGTTHCANAHFSRQATPGEDIDDWRTTFTSATVVPR